MAAHRCSWAKVPRQEVLVSAFVEQTATQSLASAIGATAAGKIDFPLAGTQPQAWELNYTGTLAGNTTVTLHFDPAPLAGMSLSSLVVEHFQNGVWSPVSNQMLDPAYDTVTFTTTSLSPFALAVPEPPTRILAVVGLTLLVFFARRQRRLRRPTDTRTP